MKSVYIIRVILIIIFLFMVPVFSEKFAPGEESTILLGSGYNSVTGKDLDQCMVVNQTTTLANVGSKKQEVGGTVHVDYLEISNHEQLNALNRLSTSAKLGLGDITLGADQQLINSSDFNDNDYFLAVKTTVTNQTEVLNQYKLIDSYKALLRTDKNAFLKICGNQFVAARNTGGEFVALVHLKTTSSNEKRELEQNFKTTFQGFFSGNVKNTENLYRLYNKYNGSISAYRRGGVSELPDFTPDSLKKYATTFPKEVLGAKGTAIPYVVITKPYSETLTGISTQPIELISASQVLQNLSEYYDKALDRHSELRYILLYPEQFSNVNKDELIALDNDTTALLDKIRRYAAKCAANPTNVEACKFSDAQNLTLPSAILPQRVSGNYKLARTPECGIESFDFTDVPRSCRTASNGEEAIETKENLWRTDDRLMSGGGVSSPGFCERKAKNDRYDYWQGLDKNVWRFINSKAVQPYGSMMHFTDCTFYFKKYQYILGANPACGSDKVPDKNKPIYKECRHPSHGIEI